MRLTAIRARRTCQIVVPNILFETSLSTPIESPMGSTTSGNATPTIMIGLAMPRNEKIDRVGIGRVRMMVAPS
jgi:hypothetical protein